MICSLALSLHFLNFYEAPLETFWVRMKGISRQQKTLWLRSYTSLELELSSLVPTRHNLGHFRDGLHSQSLECYCETKHLRKIHKLNTTQKANKAKYSKTKLSWFSHLL